ncbi:MAG: 2OG-Fe(II) oxygenase [Actinomycetia bacterium]|nr:2OG-Fe(II) oxygenase [Actinomycetes bacterium]
MSQTPREKLGGLLRDLRSEGSFSTRRTTPVGDLDIEVQGVGPLRLPVPASQAKQLRLVARPAKYGQGEQTVFDRRVHDTWEVPRSRVKIDKRKWNRTLRPMLTDIAGTLGLTSDVSLTAELHSMLVYEPGQFFASHQDSEKSDEMIGSLVVMLPSASTGGELVVEHHGETATYGESRSCGCPKSSHTV